MNKAMPSNTGAIGPAAATVTPVKAFLMLVGLVVVMGAFLFLNHMLGITETWAAFLFLLYWGGIEQLKIEKLPACFVGAVLGILLALSLRQLPLWLGNAGAGVFLGVLLVVVYCQLMGWLMLAVNMATMIFLTVGTLPPMQASADFPGALIALAVATVFFAGLAGVGKLLSRNDRV